jgi:LPS-assembly protein
MRFFRREQLGVLILLLAGNVLAADGLAPFRVDPALLGGAIVAEPSVDVAAPPSAKPPASESRPSVTPAVVPQSARAAAAPPATVPPAAETIPPVASGPRSGVEIMPPVTAGRRTTPPSASATTPAPFIPHKIVQSENNAAPSPVIPLSSSTPEIDTLKPLHVDPALLGTQPVLATTPRPTPRATTPPQPNVQAPFVAAAAPSSSPIQTLEPFRVDPLLLGPAPALAGLPKPSANQETPSASPPEIADTSAVPPLYSAHVAAGLLPDLHMKPSRALLPRPDKTAGPIPSFLTADVINGKTDVEMRADGNAELRQYGSVMTADRLVYRDQEEEVEGTGNVHLWRDDDKMSGPHMKLKLNDSTGVFDSPTYSVTRVPLNSNDKPTHLAITGQGKAERLDFEGEDRYRMTNATYSTCPAGSGDPDWFARVSDIALDYTEERAVAHGATVYFEGVPILYSPWMSFSLNNQRESGFLSPSIGSTTQGGGEFTVPFYWNIAPNMDATVAVREMSKRGVQWQGEYRYLGANYHGEVTGEYMDRDKVFGKSRDALSILHSQNFGDGFSGNVNINHVSDDTYFTDLSNRLTNISQTNLMREGDLSYSGGWWGATVKVQRFQTLQDPAQPPVAVPYERLPQVSLTATRPDLPFGLTLAAAGDYVDFSLPKAVPTQAQVEGKRATFYPQLSFPFQTAAFYVTPKIGFSSTHYMLRQQTIGVPEKLTRNVPITSVDSGMTFERDTNWFGGDMIQTLEPRFYYLRVPFRDQSQIPVFDTGVADFNFAQIFSENIFTGGDRIADANQATVGLTSRLIDPATGTELFKAMIGERYYFTDQRVTLPGIAPRSRSIADFLAALTGKMTHDLSLDVALEYDTQDKRMQRYDASVRYQPEIDKVLNAGFNYDRNQRNQLANGGTSLNQIDVSAQWPLFGHWYGVGRYNYSFSDRRVVESVAGFEYNGSCWVGRVVIQRLGTAIGRSNSSLFFQLELNGFSQIGSSPITLLKRNIPGYSRVNQLDPESEFSPDQYQAP